eukprot:6204363-Pleurochrysis_carterae.AAC.1
MLPNTLLYIVDRLAGFSTNIFKIQPNGSSTATANNIVTFDLPSNSLIHTRSLRVYFRASLTGTTARLPADIHSLIERVEVSAGGNPLAHSEIVRAKSYFDGTTLTGTNPESPAGFLCWNQWDSTFLGSCEPSFIDTALLPDLRV